MRFQFVARGLAALITVPVLASGCSFLIPENPSEPRYNTVLGERRMPQENAKMTGAGGATSGAPAPATSNAPAPVRPQSMVEQAPLPVVAAAPAPAPIMSTDLPPVDPMTQRIAAERMQQQAAAPAVAGGANGRTVPSENSTQLAASDYPKLNQVPPAPPVSGAGSDAQRLEAVRRQLELDRAAAAQTTRQVRDAAAAEPSMLGPNGELPAPQPIMAPAPAPAPAPQSFNAPSGQGNMVVASLPPPPPAPMAVVSKQAPIQMDKIPMNTAPVAAPRAMEPITLRPPVVAAPAPQFVPTPPPAAATPTYRSMPAAAGSFDPMAGASYSSNTASNGYLPVSRYSSYRR